VLVLWIFCVRGACVTKPTGTHTHGRKKHPVRRIGIRMGIRIGIEIRLTRPKHLSHLTCVSICVWVSVCLSVKSDPPPPYHPPSEPLATGNHVLVSNMQLKTIFFFWLLNVIACNQNGSMLRLRNFTFPSPTFPTTHRTACNTFDATGCRAARRRNAFTNSIAIQPSFEAVQALATSLYIIHTL